MKFTELTLRLLLLFFPGIITRLIIEKYTVYEEKRHFYFVLYAFVFGMAAYALYYAFLVSFNLLPFVSIDVKVYFLDALLNAQQKINITEIFLVCGLATLNGFVLSALINKRFIHKIAYNLGITKKFADLDVWGYLHNSDDDALRWIRVRDHEHNLVYEGYVEAFSDTFKDNEMFLREVMVSKNDTGDFLYDVPGLYISRKQDAITIEFFVPESKKEEVKNGKR